jgi:NAD+ kinase
MLNSSATEQKRIRMRVVLFGPRAADIEAAVRKHPELEVVETDPEVVVSYGGDGTLLSAEHLWPGVPKVPIRNSRRGLRCMAHPPETILERLARGGLIRTEFMKLACSLRFAQDRAPGRELTAMNEFSVHMSRLTSALRFRLWIDEESYGPGQEILGDGFVVSTPFGSTAYFKHITRGYFHSGIGIAFKSTSEQVNHLIVADNEVLRILITRGPAMLAYDNVPETFDLTENDELTLRKHPGSTVLLTWSPMRYPSDAF